MKKTSKNMCRLIQLLSEHHYSSGTELGETLHISRAAVWKMIKAIQERGILIECMHKKGYRLAQPLVLLDEKLIRQYLQEPGIPISIEVYDKIKSTNSFLLQNLSQMEDNIRFCLSEEQSAGCGRLSRHWFSPYTQNLYLSMRIFLPYDPLGLGKIVHHISLGIVHTLQAFGIADNLAIKWPNDIMYGNKKISGILIQSVFESNSYCGLVVGIGLNVNSDAQVLDTLDKPATSMKQILGHYMDRNPIAATLMNKLITCYKHFSVDPTHTIPNEWKRYDYLYGKRIQLTCGEHTYTGTAKGVNDYGHLQLESDGGKMRVFSAGDTTILH